MTRLCLNGLDSAKMRREESRSDRLPEPVDLGEGGIGRVEMLDQVSMAFLVVLQRPTPAERAVLLLRDESAAFATFLCRFKAPAGSQRSSRRPRAAPTWTPRYTSSMFAALLLGVADGRIHRVFFDADTARLRYLGPRRGVS